MVIRATLLFLIVVLIFLEEGCYSPLPTRRYVGPVQGDRASVTFVDRSGVNNLMLSHFTGDPKGCNCTGTDGFEEPIVVFHDKTLFMDKFGNKETDRVAIEVPAASEFRFRMKVPSYGSAIATDKNVITGKIHLMPGVCQVHQGFVPKAGHAYLATYDPAVSPCAFVITDKTLGGVPVISMTYPPCAYYNGNGDGADLMVLDYCKAYPEPYRDRHFEGN